MGSGVACGQHPIHAMERCRQRHQETFFYPKMGLLGFDISKSCLLFEYDCCVFSNILFSQYENLKFLKSDNSKIDFFSQLFGHFFWIALFSPETSNAPPRSSPPSWAATTPAARASGPPRAAATRACARAAWTGCPWVGCLTEVSMAAAMAMSVT